MSVGESGLDPLLLGVIEAEDQVWQRREYIGMQEEGIESIGEPSVAQAVFRYSSGKVKVDLLKNSNNNVN